MVNGYNNQNLSTAGILPEIISIFEKEDFFINLIRMSLFPTDFGAISGGQGRTEDKIITFLKDLDSLTKKLRLKDHAKVSDYCKLIETILVAREGRADVLNEKNIGKYVNISSLSVSSKKLIQTACGQPIENNDEFKSLKAEVISDMTSFYDVDTIKKSISLMDNLRETIASGKLSVFEVLKEYKKTIIEQYGELDKLQTLKKKENLSNYFDISDITSCEKLSNNIVQFISEGYNMFNTGYKIFDNYIKGFESSSVHIVSGASNSGKSIFLVNLYHTLIKCNIDTFEEKDAIVFLTMEDNIYTLCRKFIAIFGHYDIAVTKDLFIKAKDICDKNKDTDTKNRVTKLFNDLLQKSIAAVTNGKVHVLVRHEPENTFSPQDLVNWIDTLKADGYNVKAVFADYVDTFAPSFNRYTSYNDYDTHGIIVQELRNIAKAYKVPVITATQNSKASENMNTTLDNTQIGDSYKKIRYADFVYMVRINKELTFTHEKVKKHVLTDKDYSPQSGISPEILKIQDEIASRTHPFEIVITKSKESEKNVSAYGLFCRDNLCIYDNVRDYIEDAKKIDKNTKELIRDIDALATSSFSEVTDLFNDDPLSNYDADVDPFLNG